MTRGAESDERESPAGVIGVGSGLLILVAVAGFLLWFRGGESDPAAILAEISTLDAPPSGLVVERAVRLPGGDRMLLLRVEDPAALGLDGAAPEQIVVASYRSKSAVDALWRGSEKPDREKVREWEEELDFSFRETLHSGELEWDEWSAPFARERDYRRDGVWSDMVRVSVTREDAPAVIFATWPDGIDADEKQLLPILRALSLRAE